ncbi:hypothetical protein [Limosilactobacillus equigenerosi]|uniref:hypothetical protein n=1 Tax=Limosilactobacillus equigenerosi TaxID=417373 RepID=UPI00070556F5|nr:hypothetical protein [Limosilactobacillus equigenerosi]
MFKLKEKHSRNKRFRATQMFFRELLTWPFLLTIIISCGLYYLYFYKRNIFHALIPKLIANNSCAAMLSVLTNQYFSTVILIIFPIAIYLFFRKISMEHLNKLIIPRDKYVMFSYNSFKFFVLLTGRNRIYAQSIPVPLIAQLCTKKDKFDVIINDIAEETYPVKTIKINGENNNNTTANIIISSTYCVTEDKIPQTLLKYDLYHVSDWFEGVNRHYNEELIYEVKKLKNKLLSEGISQINLLLYIPPKVIEKLMVDVFDRTLPSEEQFEDVYIYDSSSSNGFMFKNRHHIV